MANAEIELPLLAKRLKEMGLVGIRKQMLTDLRKAAEPVKKDLKRQALADLPKGGGLNEFVAKKPIRTSVRTGARTAGVSVRYTGPGRHSDISGGWRHPVFNHRDRKWATTDYEPAVGWWERGGEAAAPEARLLMANILGEVGRKVNGRVL
jgi:hypothetical protein